MERGNGFEKPFTIALAVQPRRLSGRRGGVREVTSLGRLAGMYLEIHGAETHHNNPLPGVHAPGGLSTRVAWGTYPHGALKSREAYPSQSSPQQGCCHTDHPTRSRRSSDPRLINIASPSGLLSRGPTCSPGSEPAWRWSHHVPPYLDDMLLSGNAYSCAYITPGYWWGCDHRKATISRWWLCAWLGGSLFG
jgi:hypothetical protein